MLVYLVQLRVQSFPHYWPKLYLIILNNMIRYFFIFFRYISATVLILCFIGSIVIIYCHYLQLLLLLLDHFRWLIGLVLFKMAVRVDNGVQHRSSHTQFFGNLCVKLHIMHRRARIYITEIISRSTLLLLLQLFLSFLTLLLR